MAADRPPLVVRCQSHPVYDGQGAPVRAPGGEPCGACAYVAQMRGAAVMAHARRGADDLTRPVRLRWGS